MNYKTENGVFRLKKDFLGFKKGHQVEWFNFSNKYYICNNNYEYIVFDNEFIKNNEFFEKVENYNIYISLCYNTDTEKEKKIFSGTREECQAYFDRFGSSTHRIEEERKDLEKECEIYKNKQGKPSAVRFDNKIYVVKTKKFVNPKKGIFTIQKKHYSHKQPRGKRGRFTKQR